MPKIGMELPENLAEAIKLPLKEVPMRLRRELAVRLYEKRLLGFGKARQLAEMPMWEFQRLLSCFVIGFPRLRFRGQCRRRLLSKVRDNQDHKRFNRPNGSEFRKSMISLSFDCWR
jgi:hypothetical protein